MVPRTCAAGTTVLIIEQNVSHVLGMADRGYALENGRIVLSGTGEELLGSDRLRAAYLGL
jgi:branched-chain amino acid transport system ATP-binding protein